MQQKTVVKGRTHRRHSYRETSRAHPFDNWAVQDKTPVPKIRWSRTQSAKSAVVGFWDGCDEEHGGGGDDRPQQEE